MSSLARLNQCVDCFEVADARLCSEEHSYAHADSDPILIVMCGSLE